MKKKVLIACGPEMLPEETLATLRDLFELSNKSCSAEISETERKVDGIVMGGYQVFDQRTLEKLLGKGGWIIFLGIQYETFFTKDGLVFCQEHQIPIYTTGEGSLAVARRTASVILDWNPIEVATLTAAKFVLPMPIERELMVQKVLVVGAGTIGAEVIRRVTGKVKEVRYWSRREKPELRELATYYPDLLEAFGGVDVATLHLSLSDETRSIIRQEHLANMAKVSVPSLLINTARAELVDLSDLAQAYFSGMGIRNVWDVYYMEGADYERLRSEGVLLRTMIKDGFIKFTGHTFAMEAGTARERGERLLFLIRERSLADK